MQFQPRLSAWGALKRVYGSLQVTTQANKSTVCGQKLAFFGHFWAKTVFLCARRPAKHDRLGQYNCKHISVCTSPSEKGIGPYNSTPRQKEHCFRPKKCGFGPFLGENSFFLCWRPCNTQQVAPIQLGICYYTILISTSSILTRRAKPTHQKNILQNLRACESKERPMVMKTKANRNKLRQSEHPSIWFSQSVQHGRTCKMNTELRHLHFQRYNNANTATDLKRLKVRVPGPNCGGFLKFQITI